MPILTPNNLIEVNLCVQTYAITHLITIMPGSKLYFQANKNAELADESIIIG